MNKPVQSFSEYVLCPLLSSSCRLIHLLSCMCVCVCVCVCAFVQSVVDSIQCSVCANYFIFKLCGTDVVGLPELKKVVVVPYVKSAGEEAAFGNIKNGFVCATLQLAFYVTFICYSIYLLTAVTCAKFKIMLHYS